MHKSIRLEQRFLLLTILLLIWTAILLAGCAAPTSTPEPTPTHTLQPTATPSPTQTPLGYVDVSVEEIAAACEGTTTEWHAYEVAEEDDLVEIAETLHECNLQALAGLQGSEMDKLVGVLYAQAIDQGLALRDEEGRLVGVDHISAGTLHAWADPVVFAEPIVASCLPNENSPLEDLVILRGEEYLFDPGCEVSGGEGEIAVTWDIDGDGVVDAEGADPEGMSLEPGVYFPVVTFRDDVGQEVVVELPKIVKVGEPDYPDWKYGVNTLFPDNIGAYDVKTQQQAIDLVSELPADAVRIWFFWDQIEKTNGLFSFFMYDQLMKKMEKGGIEVLAVVSWTPRWASLGDQTTNNYFDWAFNLPNDNQDYVEFVTTLAKHYGSRIGCYEIYNEPNNSNSCKDCEVDNYLPLLKESYLAIKYVDPSLCVSMGGLAENGIEAIDKATTPRYLDEFLYKGGALSTDFINIHPYIWPKSWTKGKPLESYVDRIDETRKVMLKHNVKLPILIGETGWPSGESGVTLQDQADLITTIFPSDELNAIILFWYRFEDRDTNQEPYNFFTNSGLVFSDLTPKPSYWAFYELGNK